MGKRHSYASMPWGLVPSRASAFLGTRPTGPICRAHGYSDLVQLELGRVLHSVQVHQVLGRPPYWILLPEARALAKQRVCPVTHLCANPTPVHTSGTDQCGLLEVLLQLWFPL